jgi:eukaryotic-like serine/threonine-protein kinase
MYVRGRRGVSLRGRVGKVRMGDKFIGKVLGNGLKIVRLLGQGGMGSVYLAEDMQLERPVAVKVLRTFELSSPTNWERFRREGQSLSKLEHPHIVKVFGFGNTDDGELFLSMEYLSGRSLAQVLVGESPLGWRRVVDIAMQICDGLSYVHASGLVHRDLKPQNIMLLDGDKKDFVKLLDFGLVLLLAPSVQKLTRTGTLIGTPQYMSPEGCQGKMLDSRSDIYSLACILYECLTGKPPFADENSLELIRKQRTEMPARLERLVLSAGVPAALELLIFKALAKQPDNRPQSMSDFESALRLISEGKSEELTLDGFTVESASSDGDKKESHLQAVAIVAIVCAAILIGGICLQRPGSKETRNAGTKTLPLVSSSVDADVQKLERDVGAYEHRLNSNSLALADLQERLGIKYSQHHELGKAEQVLKRSLVIREKEIGPNAREVADSLNALAMVYLGQQRKAEAEPLFKRSLAIRKKALGPEHHDFADSLSGLAMLYQFQRKYSEAEPLFKQALAIQEKEYGPEDRHLVDNFLALAWTYLDQERFTETEHLLKRALAIQEKAFGPEHPELIRSLSALALLFERQGLYSQAEKQLKRVLSIRKKVSGPEHPDLADSQAELAGVLIKEGKYAQAEELAKESLAIRQKALGPDHPAVARSRELMSVCRRQQGKVAGADEPAEKTGAAAQRLPAANK